MKDSNLNQVREELEMFLSSQSVSQAALARALGISSASISTFRKNEYKGNNEELAKKIKLYLDNYLLKNRAGQTPKSFSVYESHDKQMADFIISEAVLDKEIALITGVAGSGKSTIARDYASKHPNAILMPLPKRHCIKKHSKSIKKNLKSNMKGFKLNIAPPLPKIRAVNLNYKE